MSWKDILKNYIDDKGNTSQDGSSGGFVKKANYINYMKLAEKQRTPIYVSDFGGGDAAFSNNPKTTNYDFIIQPTDLKTFKKAKEIYFGMLDNGWWYYIEEEDFEAKKEIESHYKALLSGNLSFAESRGKVGSLLYDYEEAHKGLKNIKSGASSYGEIIEGRTGSPKKLRELAQQMGEVLEELSWMKRVYK